jgi:hypothetical protein
MGSIAELKDFSQKAPPSWELLKQELNPFRNELVVVVGPSASIGRDSTLLESAITMAGSKGQLLVVDPKHQGATADRANGAGDASFGIGDYDAYLKQLIYLKELGIPMKIPTWLGPASSGQQMLVKSNSIGLIIDHCTLGFVYQYANKSKKLDIEQSLKLVQLISQEYIRVLRPGGKIYLQINCRGYEFAGNLKEASAKPFLPVLFEGLTLCYSQQVTDIGRIALSPRVYQSILKHEKKLDCKAEIPPIRIRNLCGYRTMTNQVLFFNRYGHIGNEVYVYTK